MFSLSTHSSGINTYYDARYLRWALGYLGAHGSSKVLSYAS
ncbi:MAG: hypothetical protein QXH39_06295 [Conexivisphaerales archaeon]